MYTPTSSFKMDKQSKKILATLDGSNRAAWKRAAVESQLIFEENKKRALKNRQKDKSED